MCGAVKYKLGFEIKFKSKNTIEINGVPSDLNSGSEGETLIGIINEFRINAEEKHLEERDNIAKSFSLNLIAILLKSVVVIPDS